MFSANKFIQENAEAKNLVTLLGKQSFNFDSPQIMYFNPYTNSTDMPLGVNTIQVPFNDITKKAKRNELATLLMNAWISYYNIPQSVIDEWNRLTLAGADANKQKTFWEKAKEAATNTFNNIGNTVTTVFEDAKDAAKNLGDKLQVFLNNAPQNVAFAPLLPFVPAMRNQLNKRGFSVSGLGILDISKMFLENVVQGKSNYQFAHLDPTMAASFATSPEGKDMIKQILDFFLTLANKPTLSTNDKEMLKDAEGGLDEILDTKKVEVSGFLKYILIAVGIFIAYKFIKK